MPRRAAASLLAVLAVASLAACSDLPEVDPPSATASVDADVVLSEDGLALVDLPPAPDGMDNAATCEAYFSAEGSPGPMLMGVMMVALAPDMTPAQTGPIMARAFDFVDASEGAVREAVLDVNELATVRHAALEGGSDFPFDALAPGSVEALIRACGV